MKTAFGDSPGGAAGARGGDCRSPSSPSSSPSRPPRPALCRCPVVRSIPTTIPKYQEPLVIPPAMPRSGVLAEPYGRQIDYYEIVVKQFQQYILPEDWSEENDIDPTTVWSYASMRRPATGRRGRHAQLPGAHHRGQGRAGRCASSGSTGWWTRTAHYLPHLFAVDQTLHWANPRRRTRRDRHARHGRHAVHGPVPIVTHVHGAHTTEDSDGYPEAWYLPAAERHPGRLRHRRHASSSSSSRSPRPRWGQTWEPGAAVFQYPNDQRPTTLWYHDHTLGMTRLNVYAGPGGLLPAAQGRRPGRAGACRGRLRSAATSRARSTTRSPSPSRTGRSTPTGRCSIPTTAPSSRV